MGTYDEIIQSLSEMESRYQSGFSFNDRSLLDELHRLIFGKEITNTGCSDCYRDAYVLIVHHLNKTKEMPAKSNYILKGGALIHPLGTSKFYTNAIPDEVAEDYLSKYPSELNKFAAYPEDWEARVDAYKTRKGQEEYASVDAATIAATNIAVNKEFQELKTSLAEAGQQIESLRKDKEDLSTTVKTLTEEKAELTQKVEALNTLLSERTETESVGENSESEEIANLQMELATAKEELEAAKAEIGSLKTDNRALKAANTRLKNNGAKEPEENVSAE